MDNNFTKNFERDMHYLSLIDKAEKDSTLKEHVTYLQLAIQFVIKENSPRRLSVLLKKYNTEKFNILCEIIYLALDNHKYQLMPIPNNPYNIVRKNKV